MEEGQKYCKDCAYYRKYVFDDEMWGKFVHHYCRCPETGTMNYTTGKRFWEKEADEINTDGNCQYWSFMPAPPPSPAFSQKVKNFFEEIICDIKFDIYGRRI